MKQRAGLFILIFVALVVGVYTMMRRTSPPAGSTQTAGGAAGGEIVTVHGYAGGEKLGFLADPDVARILADKYGLRLDAAKLGSIEMATTPTAGKDFLWPSSQVALEMFKEHGGKSVKSDIVFNSPIVLYSWDFVTDALIKQGVVQKQGDEYYIVDLPKLIALVNHKTSWKSIGLPQLYGSLSVRSTDPAKSNSGMSFAGLLASIANGGEVVDDSTVGKTLPTVKSFFGRLGYMEASSGDQFDQFLKMGEGANPLVVGYENQLVEFSIANAQYRDMIKQRIRILYPRPTVWSSHVLIALDPNGAKLLDALQDPEIEKIAWEKHGFRSGLLGAQNDPKVLQLAGIPAKIENVIPMPTPRVMERIIKSVGGQ